MFSLNGYKTPRQTDLAKRGLLERLQYGYVRGDFHPPTGHIRLTISLEKSVVD